MTTAPEPIAFERIHNLVGGDPLTVSNAARYLTADASDDEIRAAVRRAGDEMDHAEYRAAWRCPQ